MWRHVQQFGLAATYQQRRGMYDYIRQLMALPFLPAQHIRQAFDHLKTKANTEQLQRLVNYMDRQWFQHAVLMLPPGVSSDRRCEPTMMSKVTSLQL